MSENAQILLLICCIPVFIVVTIGGSTGFLTNYFNDDTSFRKNFNSGVLKCVKSMLSMKAFAIYTLAFILWQANATLSAYRAACNAKVAAFEKISK